MCALRAHSLGSPVPPWEGPTANRHGQPNLAKQAHQSAQQDGCYLDDTRGVNKNLPILSKFFDLSSSYVVYRGRYGAPNTIRHNESQTWLACGGLGAAFACRSFLDTQRGFRLAKHGGLKRIPVLLIICARHFARLRWAWPGEKASIAVRIADGDAASGRRAIWVVSSLIIWVAARTAYRLWRSISA